MYQRYLIHLFYVGNHDNDGRTLLPYHSPEVSDSINYWSLSSNIYLFLSSIALPTKEQEISFNRDVHHKLEGSLLKSQRAILDEMLTPGHQLSSSSLSCTRVHGAKAHYRLM